MISIQEVQGAIRTKLIGDTSITNMVGDRIHTTHFYDFDNGTTPMPLVIIELEGGSANYGGGNQTLTFYIYSYSKEGSSEAGELYDKISTTLHAQKISFSNQSGFIQEIGRPISDYNPSARSYFFRGTYICLSAG